MPADSKCDGAQMPHSGEVVTLLAAAILRLHQRAALAEKQSPESMESSLDVPEKTVLMDKHGLTV